MRGALINLDAATAAVGKAWAEALPPFGLLGDEDVSLAVGQMDDDGLLVLLDSVTALGRRVDALTAAVAAEVADRSPLGSREDSLAHRAGFGSPGRLVAASSGGTVGRASVLMAVGRSTAARRSLAGEVLPSVHPHVASGLRDGAVSMEAAHLIVGMLDRVRSLVTPDMLDHTERVLAEHAARFPLDLLTTLVKETEGLLNPDGVAPREEILRQGRSLVLKEDKSGRIVLRGEFDPETGAPIKAVLEAIVERAQRVARGHNHPGCELGLAGGGVEPGDDGGAGSSRDARDARGVQSVMDEMRTSAQIRADGLADMARHVLGCEDRMPGLPAVAVMVHMDLEDLQDRFGGRKLATIDGVDQPISAATARRLACSAELIPAMFGGSSLPLDLGRSARLFSRAQILALWARDRGCASCGQTTFVEAHHATMDWVKGGRTDLRDGVLLCSRCHHRVHRYGWEIRIDADGAGGSGAGSRAGANGADANGADANGAGANGPGASGKVWFIPPAFVDPDRRPRPGVQRQSLREKGRRTDEAEGTGDIGT